MCENKLLVSVLKNFFAFGKTKKNEIAVVDCGGNRKTTFGEFIDIVNTFGNYLKKHGIKKGDCIAICLGRTMEHIALRVASESIGAVFVSINDDYPEDRKNKIIQCCRAKIIISESTLCEIKIENSECCLDEQVSDNEAGFIFFTSGTTGNPKGVLHNRTVGCLENSLQKMFFNTVPKIRHAAFSDFMFIMTVIDEACLHAGGTVYIIDNDMRCNVPKLREFFIENKITTTGIFPDLLYLLGRDIPLSVALIAGSSSKHNFDEFNFSIINVYGCSECPIISFGAVKNNKTFIGKTIPEGRIMLLSDNGTESIQGEICYKGPAIMEKYIDEPELTNKTIFVDSADGQKIIHTGDLGKIVEDGIEIIGRKDSMVKIRGKRVEPAEIEFCIKNIDGVNDAVVKAFSDDSGEKYLCAFFTGDKNAINSQTVHQSIEKALPDYMIPRHIIHLDAFPYNASGKIERTKLNPAILSVQNNKDIIEAKTDKEKALVSVIQKVLKIDKVSMTDNFFELGGDSILAMFVVSELRKSGFELSITNVVQSDTIEKMASLLKQSSENEDLSLLRGETVAVPDKSVYSVFEETVQEKPYDICIVTDEKNYTFAEFDNLVELFDSKIREVTHEKKQTIAVIAERSIEMYAAIYAIVRGGNSYLPIDPDYPAERMKYMLADSGAALVLTQDKFCDLVKETRRLNVSAIIQSGELLEEKLPSAALPDDIAYIIYTSGSTGKPKGVKISNKSLLNRILWMEKEYPLDGNSVILQKTPFTFDVSLWEIFWWGLFGGKMAFMKPKEHFLPEKITDEICSKKVTVIHFVPSVFDLFVKYLENNPAQREKISTLKHIFISGEVLSAALINRFHALFESKKIKLHNLYGPTECAVDVTFYDCKKEESDPLPIGKPIDNTDIFIVDNGMNLLPKGATGEICIGGVNVAVGYVNNEALTNEVFLKNPFGEGKIYKTGDLGYINSENEIIFCGRKDDQIKLNGQRIEPCEIESAISEIDGVTLAAVVVRQNKEGNRILCAFYSGEKKESREIRKKLEAKLPRYMIPQIITHLDEMPLTSSGKIDRLSLPETDLENIVSDREFVEAETDEEKALIEAVKKVLKIDCVSTKDNFFELGGDSIQAIFVASELKKAGFELSVTDITLHGTISEIALLMKPTERTEIEKQTQTNGIIPFTPIMKIYSDLGEHKLKELAQTQIVSCGKFGEIEVRKALEAIFRHHDMLRSVVSRTYLKIRDFTENDSFELKMKDVRGMENVAEIIGENSDVTFDLENGPLVKAILYFTDSENFLKITIHHLVVDGVSWRIIADDFRSALEQLSCNKEIKLIPEATSFEVWAKNLEYYKKSTDAANELNYWNNVLDLLNKNNYTILNCNENCKEQEYNFVLEKPITWQLLTIVNKTFGTHADELLLVALGEVLKEICGKNDFGICIENHGRELLYKNIDVSRTVGWFTSYFPMILKCGNTLDETIANVKETMRLVPKKGAGYPLFFGKIPDETEIIYNFIGTVEKQSQYAFSTFQNNASRNAIPNKIMINSIIVDDALYIFISIKGNLQENVAAAIGSKYEKHIENLINYCFECKENVKKLSDYSDSTLKESELEDFEQMFGERQ